MEMYRDFCAKILLFGEYSVICNSMGLTIPYARYKGRFRRSKDHSDKQKQSAESLKKFYVYLKELSEKGELAASLDLDLFKKELDEGLYFDSQIPLSYGVGSSGALCAAVFDAFGKGKQEKDLPRLKNVFARMESFFHGTSSGLDPLISYLNRPLLIHSKEKLQIVQSPAGLLSDGFTTFLADTQHGKETGNLVNMFLEKCRHDEFYEEIKNNLIPLNNKCIQLFIRGEAESFLAEVKQLSAFFLAHFKPMIPAGFAKLWEDGLKSDQYTLKLCGSGGGGFLLGFTRNFETTKKVFEKIPLYPLEFRNT